MGTDDGARAGRGAGDGAGPTKTAPTWAALTPHELERRRATSDRQLRRTWAAVGACVLVLFGGIAYVVLVRGRGYGASWLKRPALSAAESAPRPEAGAEYEADVDDPCARRRGKIALLSMEVPYVEVGQFHYGHNVPVLLLHGASYSAETWERLGTLEALSGPGCRRRVTALDLPGGAADTYMSPEGERATHSGELLTHLTTRLYAHHVVRPAIVTPSMAGKYVMPLARAFPSRLKALVAVAPVGTDFVPRYRLAAMGTVKTLVVWGENDRSGLAEPSAKRLLQIPGSKQHVIRGAGHACYLDEPEEFHRVVREFLEDVDRPRVAHAPH